MLIDRRIHLYICKHCTVQLSFSLVYLYLDWLRWFIVQINCYDKLMMMFLHHATCEWTIEHQT